MFSKYLTRSGPKAQRILFPFFFRGRQAPGRSLGGPHIMCPHLILGIGSPCPPSSPWHVASHGLLLLGSPCPAFGSAAHGLPQPPVAVASCWYATFHLYLKSCYFGFQTGWVSVPLYPFQISSQICRVPSEPKEAPLYRFQISFPKGE